MQLWRRLCIFVLIALLVACLSGFFPLMVSAQSSLTVHNLDTGLSYASVEEALDDNSTLDGHVIRVDSSVYNERVVVSKAVSIIGENSLDTIIDGQGNGTVVDVLAPNVTITGFTIRNSGSFSGSAGVRVYRSSLCNVSGNVIEGNWYGVWIQSCNSPTVSDNNFTGNQNAIYADSSADCHVSRNSFSGNDFAVWLSGVESMDFQLNNVSANGYAVWMAQSVNVSVIDNRIVDNLDGVLVYNNSSTIKLTGNTISSEKNYAVLLNDCSNSSVVGNHVSSTEKEAVYVQGSQGCSLRNNVVSGKGHDGIYLYQSDDNVVDSNLVTEGGSAIVVYSSLNNVISGNDLFGNAQGIQVTVSRNTELEENNVSGSVNEGVYLALSTNTTVLSNFVSESGKGIVLMNSSKSLIAGNYISECEDGLRLEGSRGNTVSDNTFYLNNGSGIVLSASGNNTVSSNEASNSTAGIRLEFSSNNVVMSNGVSNSVNGMEVEQSAGDSFIRNNLLTNNVGMLLSHSSNDTVTENHLGGNNVGLVLNVSDNNQIQGNVLTGNANGVRLSNSHNNTMQLNAVSSNSGAGIYAVLSDSNFFLHNAFFNNSLAPVSVNSTNRWDDGIEGNYWGSTGLVDADRNGIGDAPFVLGDSDRDNFPLIAEYAQLVAVMDDRQYLVGFVCNSSVSDLRYFRDPENATTLLTFRVSAFEGLGFCRIAIPRALIQPPFDVTVDNVAPLYQRVVGSNGTHSWLCFSFPYVAGEVRIVNAAPSPPFWTELWFWGIVALAVVVAVLALAVYMFYRRLGAYRRTVEDVERRLRERERSPLEVARRLFGADVERRSVKIGKFEEKYGIKIRPRESLDDIFRGLEKKDKERGDKDEVNS